MVIKTKLYHNTLILNYIECALVFSNRRSYSDKILWRNFHDKTYHAEKNINTIVGPVKFTGDYFEKSFGEEFFNIDIQQLIPFHLEENMAFSIEKQVREIFKNRLVFLSFHSGEDVKLIPP